MTKYTHLFFRRITKDFKQKELLPVKFLFFIQMSTILVLYPYLTIHMRELGINVEETAIMSAVTPVVGILMPPVAGMLADKIGNFRVLLAGFSVFGGLSALLLLLVPIGRITVTYPESIVLGVSCNADSPLNLILPEEYPCASKNIDKILETDVDIESCGFVCKVYKDTSNAEDILLTNEYNIEILETETNKTTILNYIVTDDDFHVPIVLSEIRNHELIKNNIRYTTAVRKFSENSFYFPSNRLYNLSCTRDDSKEIQYNTSTNAEIQLEDASRYSCMFDKVLKGFNNSFKVGALLNSAETDTSEKIRTYNVRYILNNKEKHEPLCSANFDQNLQVTVSVTTNITDQMKLEECVPKCIATSPRKDFCENKNTLIEFDMNLTFWSYLAVRVFIGIVGGTTYTMFEGAVIAILREYKADYGLQRMYASIGGMISSPLSGWLIDVVSRGKAYTDFRPVFFLYAILKVISAVLMLFINLEFKTPATSVVSDVLSVLNVELFSLFVASFLLGSAWGYIESFLFWLIQDLGGSKSLMGLTITVGGIVGIPLLVLSGPFIKRVGHANVIFIGFIAYAIRLMGYSIIYNPWFSLIFEAMECLTHSLCFTAAVTYAARLSTVTTDTTIQGIFGGLFYGVGKSAGSLVGGYLIKLVGMRTTFQIFALVTGLTGLLYLTFYHLYMKKRSVLNAPVHKEPEIEKPPQGFENIDLNKPSINGNIQSEIVDKIKSVPYEDTLTNLAYEDNEFDTELAEKEEEYEKKLEDLSRIENQDIKMDTKKT